MSTLTKPKQIISSVLKAVIILSAVIGIYMSAFATKTAFMSGSSTFMYFTIQSNILIALIALIGGILLFRGQKIGNLWYVIKFVGTVSITLTGVVFCFVLAPTLGANAWNIQNVLTHVVVPLASIVDFFVTGTESEIKKINVLYVTLPPLVYAIYAGIGYAMNWEFAPGINYPYFFLNWGSEAGAFGFSVNLPFIGSAWWILLLLLFLIIVGFCYLFILDKLKKRS